MENGSEGEIVKRIKGLYNDDDLYKLINNNKFSDFLLSDYYTFYRYASLDRRFLKQYGNFTKKSVEFMANAAGSSSSGRGGGFSGGGGFHGGGGRGGGRRSLLNNSCKLS